MERLVAVLLGLTVVLATAACGQEGGGTAPGGSVRPSVSSPPGTSGTASPSSTPRTPQALVRTVTGTVEDGVESGCVILTGPDGTFQLEGPAVRTLPKGEQVTVTGTVDPDLMTTCQQGPVLEVTEVIDGTPDEAP